MALLAGAAFMSALPSLTVRAQDEHKHKVPVIDKITSGTDREAFSGSVQSLNMKDSLLVLHNAEYDSDEYFPFKRNVSVTTASGKYVTLDKVKPGQSVLVYYEQKGDKRTLKEIVILENAPAPKPASPEPAASDKDKSPPPS